MNQLIKFLEVRDRFTFIPCFAFKPSEVNSIAEHGPVPCYLVMSAGYGAGRDAVVFGRLDHPGHTQCDPYEWNTGARTMPQAHAWVEKEWDNIKSGDVIDVEFILGETKEKKMSQCGQE